VIKVGFRVIIQKQSNNRRIGRVHNHQWQNRRSRSRVQQRACSLFFDINGIVHREFVPPNTTVNSDFHCDVLRCLRENVRRRTLELWCNHSWLLHHGNVPTHTSLKSTEFVTNSNMVIIPHHPYLPGLALCNFALFPKLKMKLKGWRLKQCLTSNQNRKRYSTALRKMTSTVIWSMGKKWWDRCIRSQGDYFLGDGSQN
jgi:hypothetical protein